MASKRYQTRKRHSINHNQSVIYIGYRQSGNKIPVVVQAGTIDKVYTHDLIEIEINGNLRRGVTV
ncbi:hypothetical protein SD70_29340 [Gordoniibacillus kamchatkensis]|uniref:Uncharacterized protein n=1 Tax=Gordoniibacillus kamchatkensis TaxID=1590651 RepID=A0ABR5AAE9_9BACL|nr:hypothetical protein SD70_29340 [Paenibacillus sp. VKM B-2647]